MALIWGIVGAVVLGVFVLDQLVKRRERKWRAKRDAALEYLRRVRNARWN